MVMTNKDAFQPRNPDFERAVREGFTGQHAMATLGASLRHVRPGEVAIELPYRADLGQQHGFFHGGLVATLADNACGFAANSLMPAGHEPLSVEMKVNFIRPAR